MADAWEFDASLNSERQVGLLEKLMQHLPGFQGYQDAAARRASDAQSRAFIRHQLDVSKQSLDHLGRTWVDRGQWDNLPQLDQLRGEIDVLNAKLKAGPLIGQRFIDAGKLDGTILENALDHDLQTLDLATQLASSIEQQRTDPATDPIEVIAKGLGDLKASLARRAELLQDDPL
jgi:hypothetical protein